MVIEDAEKIISGITAGCEEAGCVLVGGETAEMPGMYRGDDFDLAGFSVGAMERGKELPRITHDGDIILGLSSNGVHSNGYSLVRKIVTASGLEWTDMAPFESQSLSKAFLKPTKLYVKQCMSIMDIKGIRAFAHITGGGLTENIVRTLTKGQGIEINLSNWELPPIFKWLSEVGSVDNLEMLRTFNCGIGMTIICSPSSQHEVCSVLKKMGENPFFLGQITSSGKVKYSGNFV